MANPFSIFPPLFTSATTSSSSAAQTSGAAAAATVAATAAAVQGATTSQLPPRATEGAAVVHRHVVILARDKRREAQRPTLPASGDGAAGAAQGVSNHRLHKVCARRHMEELLTPSSASEGQAAADGGAQEVYARATKTHRISIPATDAVAAIGRLSIGEIINEDLFDEVEAPIPPTGASHPSGAAAAAPATRGGGGAVENPFVQPKPHSAISLQDYLDVDEDQTMDTATAGSSATQHLPAALSVVESAGAHSYDIDFPPLASVVAAHVVTLSPIIEQDFPSLTAVVAANAGSHRPITEEEFPLLPHVALPAAAAHHVALPLFTSTAPLYGVAGSTDGRVNPRNQTLFASRWFTFSSTGAAGAAAAPSDSGMAAAAAEGSCLAASIASSEMAAVAQLNHDYVEPAIGQHEGSEVTSDGIVRSRPTPPRIPDRRGEKARAATGDDSMAVDPSSPAAAAALPAHLPNPLLPDPAGVK